MRARACKTVHVVREYNTQESRLNLQIQSIESIYIICVVFEYGMYDCYRVYWYTLFCQNKATQPPVRSLLSFLSSFLQRCSSGECIRPPLPSVARRVTGSRLLLLRHHTNHRQGGVHLVIGRNFFQLDHRQLNTLYRELSGGLVFRM